MIEQYKKEVDSKIRCKWIETFGAFHSPLMRKCVETDNYFIKLLNELKLDKPSKLFIPNVTGEPLLMSNGNLIKNNLLKQIYSPVLWYKSIESCLDFHNDSIKYTFVEIGPKRILTQLIQQICEFHKVKNIKYINIDGLDSIKNIQSILE